LTREKLYTNHWVEADEKILNKIYDEKVFDDVKYMKG
jgi:hypothetical protein